MAKVYFNPQKNHLQQEPLEIQKEENLLFELLRAGLPVASSCYGEGICGKCKIQILSGMENISSESDLEKTLKLRNALSATERIACQIQILGDITIDTPYW